MVLKPVMSVRVLKVAKPDSMRRTRMTQSVIKWVTTRSVGTIKSAKRDVALDLHTAAAQTPQNATWVQAERRRRGVGRAAWMPRERRQDMDVRSARAHGASPE